MIKLKLNTTFKAILTLLGILVCTSCSTDNHESENSPIKNFKVHSFNQSDKALLHSLYEVLRAQNINEDHSRNLKEHFSKSTFPKNFWGLAVSIYNPKHRMFRTIITKGENADEIFYSSIKKTIKNLKKKNLTFDKNSKIQLDFIKTNPKPMPYRNFVEATNSDEMFEFGIDGVTVQNNNKGKKVFFLPGDAYTHSIHSLGHFERVITRKLKLKDRSSTKYFNYQKFNSTSYVSYEDSWSELYRGIPKFGDITDVKVKDAIDNAITYIIRNQKSDGRFLYYYDATTNSYNDHEHPTRDAKVDPYYNILRHAGGGICLLDYFEAFHDKRVIAPLERSIDFLVKQLRDYKTSDNKDAAYVYYNKKSKLGGAGLALLLLSKYKLLTGKNTYDAEAKKLATHLLTQIQENGEFIYYSIYLDKEIKTAEENKKLFNFYYPGEAISGLGMYLKTISDQNEISLIKEKTKHALRFLFKERPIEYQAQYRSLPADSWLMMGIDILWDFEDMRNPLYATFVFNDADQMVNQMYTVKSAPYPDYVGSYYYTYKASYYPDGARAEGLTAALKLAEKIGDTKRIEKYKSALRLTAWATYHLVNTPEAMYFARNPKKSIGGIRFKPTRQWFRIDTIQHVTCFYLKFFYL